MHRHQTDATRPTRGAVRHLKCPINTNSPGSNFTKQCIWTTTAFINLTRPSSKYCLRSSKSFKVKTMLVTHSQVMVANAKVEKQEKNSYVIILEVLSPWSLINWFPKTKISVYSQTLSKKWQLFSFDISRV